MATHDTTRSTPDLTRLLLVGGGLFLAWRAMRGIGSLFWSVFGIAMALYWTGAWRAFGLFG